MLPTPIATLEAAAASAPHDPVAWRSMLDALVRGQATDDECGAAAALALGGSRPLRVAVVTPFFRETAPVLARCHASVVAQSYPCHHILVGDGVDLPAGFAEPEAHEAEWMRLATPSADFGDTPRAAGGARAAAQGYDAVAWLDADNTFRPHHVASLVARQVATGAQVIFSGRTMHLPDGALLPTLDPADGRAHIDTSCMLFAGDVAAMSSVWSAYPRALSLIDDRMVGRILHARGMRFTCTGALTSRYTVHHAYVYRALGLPVPPDARPDFDIGPAVRYLRGLGAAQWTELEASLGAPVVAFLRALLAHHGSSPA